MSNSSSYALIKTKDGRTLGLQTEIKPCLIRVKALEIRDLTPLALSYTLVTSTLRNDEEKKRRLTGTAPTLGGLC
ncbi:unnamed protein product [Lathyrus oleraceus]